MPDTLPVSIGGMPLTGAEVPTFFDRGGELRTVPIQTISGDRIIQVIGSTAAKRQLSGFFLGGSAVDRAQQLENMRDSAIPVLLSVGVWAEYVLITDVVLRYAEKGSVIQYFVNAETTATLSPQITSTAATAVGAIITDLVQSSSILSGGGFPGFQMITPDLSQASADAASSFAASGQVDVDLDTPSTDMMSSILSDGLLISAVAARAPSDSIVGSSDDLLQAVQVTAALATIVQAGGYVNRASSNVASLGGASFVPAIHS